MNADQATELLRYMAALWPVEMNPDQAAVWMETLAEVEADRAREAVGNLKRVKTFLPSHAEFYEAVEAIAHREELSRPALPAGSGQPVPREKAKAYIAEIRRQLAKVGNGGDPAKRAERLAKWGPGLFNGRRID